ncbi:short-chain dehydrogenease/reductase-like protein, partial [Dinothrombium tinctorium]
MSLNLLKDLENKVIIVTGSSSGVGEAVVSLFAQLNCNVVITGRNAERVSKVAAKCESLSPSKNKPLTFIGDLLMDNNVEKLVQRTYERFSRIDVVVNNMGVSDNNSTLDNSILDNDFLSKFQKCIKTDVEKRKDVNGLIKDMCSQNLVCQPEDIANLVAFLSSNASSFVSGTHLVADGGFNL